MKKRTVLKVIIIFLIVDCLVCGNFGLMNIFAGEQAYKFIDNHLHYLDFTQQTEGFEKLIMAMDKGGVEKAVVMGMPVMQMWSETDPVKPYSYLDTDSKMYYYSATDYILAMDLMKQPKSVQKRFYPFISGINPVDLNAADQIEALLKRYPDFWKGIGELFSRHDDITALTYGETPRANNQALMRIYEVAANYNLPVLLHHNISSSRYEYPIYLDELEEAVSSNPRTKFIWAHAGISRNINVPSLSSEISRVLKAYHNLNIDISWLVYDNYIVSNDEFLKDWIKLIEEFPDRVIIGSDKVGYWTDYENEITKYYKLLDELKPETANKIAKKNIERLIES